MLEEKIIKLMVCPETKQGLSLADESLSGKINDLINANSIKNRGGAAITQPVDALLLREDGQVAYVIREGIPVMLVEDSIQLDFE